MNNFFNISEYAEALGFMIILIYAALIGIAIALICAIFNIAKHTCETADELREIKSILSQNKTEK